MTPHLPGDFARAIGALPPAAIENPLMAARAALLDRVSRLQVSELSGFQRNPRAAGGRA